MKSIMKKLAGIVAIMSIAFTASAFDAEYKQVQIETTIVEAVAVNDCKFNNDAQILACPMLDVREYEEDYANEYVLKDVKLKMTGVVDQKITFEVMSGVYVHTDTIPEFGDDEDNCVYKTGISTIVCKELSLIDAYGTNDEVLLLNTYIQYNSANNNYRLINHTVE